MPKNFTVKYPKLCSIATCFYFNQICFLKNVYRISIIFIFVCFVKITYLNFNTTSTSFVR